MKLESELVVGAVGKGEIPSLSRDFQAERESPAFGLFLEAAFSTAFLPTNSATEPIIGQTWTFAHMHDSATLLERNLIHECSHQVNSATVSGH